ncbi:MAG: hypothetical protein ACREAY_02905 [Nitrososphaera sp.]|uniref:hypothetical protein n=1 Tax=Nitrososphaera sp. TaxID=1971748 RepID=UPI003D6EAF24
MSLPELAWRCTRDALMTLGEPTMQSLFWHANSCGVPMAPEEFDIVKFENALHDMVGGGADIILSIVADSLAAELRIEAAFDLSLSAIERVKQALNLAAKVEE